MDKQGHAEQGDIVHVTWLDAWSNSHGRYDEHYNYEPIIMNDVGWLVEENDAGILLAHCKQGGLQNRDYVGETFTPWEMIISWEVLV